MRIDAPKITGSFQIGSTPFPDLSSLATTSSINNMMDIVATTGSNTFVGPQTMSGSIIPAVNNTYDLGSPTQQFRHVYISSGSLYVNGTKVLGSTSQELQITTDVGQSFKVLESGADTITLQSADGNITVATSGGGDVILDPNTGIIALKGTTQVYAGNKILSSDGNNIHFGNGITVSGSMVVTGYIETQELRTTYISSSILYRSGSTKFGDELTDTHAFTGSLSVSGSISVPGSGLVSGSSQVDVMSTTNITRLATTGSNTFTGNQTLSNGQYLRGIRNSGALSINLLGIESGSDRTLMTATGDFVIQNGSLTSMLTLTTSGAPTFANQVIVANGATTGTYGFRHEGAGVWTRMGVPNNSFAYWETNASGGFMLDAKTTINGNINYSYSQSTVRSLWGGGYGGVLQIVSDNSTSARYVRMGLSDSNNSWIGGIKVDNNYLATFDGDILLSKAVDPKISSGTGIGLNIDGAALYLNRYSMSNISMVPNGGNVIIGSGTTSSSLDISSRTDAIALPKGTTGQRPTAVSGMIRFNTSNSKPEYHNGSSWVTVGASGDGSSYSNAASSAKSIKAIVGNPSSGVYWLQVANVNSGNPFQCYCDFTMDGGIGYAIIYNQYFTGAETGPSHVDFGASTITTAGFDSEYQIAPTTMISNYGLTKLAVFARTGGSSSNGITGASYYNWVAFTGPSTTQYNNIFTNGYNSNQFTGTFNSSDGNTGTAYFPNGHGNTGGVTQISTNGGTVNDYILYEYKQGSGTDPNHFWLVLNGRSGDNYWVANTRYGSSSGNVMYNRWGGVAIY